MTQGGGQGGNIGQSGVIRDGTMKEDGKQDRNTDTGEDRRSK